MAACPQFLPQLHHTFHQISKYQMKIKRIKKSHKIRTKVASMRTVLLAQHSFKMLIGRIQIQSIEIVIKETYSFQDNQRVWLKLAPAITIISNHAWQNRNKDTEVLVPVSSQVTNRDKWTLSSTFCNLNLCNWANREANNWKVIILKVDKTFWVWVDHQTFLSHKTLTRSFQSEIQIDFPKN